MIGPRETAVISRARRKRRATSAVMAPLVPFASLPQLAFSRIPLDSEHRGIDGIGPQQMPSVVVERAVPQEIRLSEVWFGGPPAIERAPDTPSSTLVPGVRPIYGRGPNRLGARFQRWRPFRDDSQLEIGRRQAIATKLNTITTTHRISREPSSPSGDTPNHRSMKSICFAPRLWCDKIALQHSAISFAAAKLRSLSECARSNFLLPFG